MSVALEYAAKCAECKRPMRPGTLVEFIKDGEKYTYIHAVSCDLEEHVPPAKPQPRFEIRTCSRTACYGAAGYGFEGKAPPVCHLCGSPWEEDPAADEPVAPAILSAAVDRIGKLAA